MTEERDDNTRSGESPTQDMSAPDHTVIIEVPRELGCYRLTKLLGRGGMGEVWQAFDTQLERDVAIKLMRKDMISNEEAVRRFTREARAVARLNHPNIVQVYAFGNEKGMAYMVMELVEGETVAQCLKRHCKLTVEDTLHIILQAIEGLSYANARGIIHRDIKPSNLMLSEDSRVKIADFGLAKMIEHDTQMTAAGTAMGSPNYMSPEQARGEEADHRSDIYALGISLYQMLLGELPFTAQSPVSVLLKQIQEPLPEPEELKTLVNGQVMALLHKMTHKSPEGRYQSYGELAAALAALQPNVKFKGAHIATASMPAAKTPTHVPSISPPPPPVQGEATSAAEAPAPPVAPVPPAASSQPTQTPSDQRTAMVSSRDVSDDGTSDDKRHGVLLPILIGVALLLIAIPTALFMLSGRENGEESGESETETASVVAPSPEPTAAAEPSPQQQDPVVSPAASPSPTQSALTPSPSPSPGSGPGGPSQRGTMQPVDITAVFTPKPTQPVGVPTVVTPLPRNNQPVATPAREVYVLGTKGAGPDEQIPTFLDRNGRTNYKSFPAGTEVTLIDSGPTMMRVQAPDDRIVYIYSRMAAPKQ